MYVLYWFLSRARIFSSLGNEYLGPRVFDKTAIICGRPSESITMRKILAGLLLSTECIISGVEMESSEYS